MRPHCADPVLSHRIEATFGASAENLGRFGRLSAALVIAAGIGIVMTVLIAANSPDSEGQSIRLEFTPVWAAAKLAVAGEAVSAFDPDTLRTAQALPSDAPPGSFFWLYPPAWHVAVMPLGLLSFSAAYLVFSVVSLTAFAVALRPLAAPLPGGVPLVLAGPTVLVAFAGGNNSLLWTAGLAAALGALGQGRTVLAGCLIALLTFKPQLGVLIPFALVAGGHWRAIAWACAGSAAILALSTAVMGLEYWGHFAAALGFVSELMTTEIVRFERMMTWYALLRMGGVEHAAAFALQLVVSALAAATVAWVWSRRDASFDLKAAALCAAIPLATYYAYHYEMTLSLLAALFLARDGFGATWRARLWLLALWLGSAPAFALAGVVPPPAAYAAPLLTATLGLCVVRAGRARGLAPRAPQGDSPLA